ncbi:MAG: ABC-F family ATP-binding cassette domain-containing protein [Clostridia bacterium]|nr:ABC-F family ATP-binding cassette domain-containing protein [Clostridia bacterium]
MGDNGTGKSTLIREIVRGGRAEITLGRLVKIAYYDQENNNLDLSNNVLNELWGRHVLSSQTDIRAALARAGLTAEDMDKKVSALSGGERAKLALAVFEAEHGNFLVLDEPTNHLDLAARESLEEALKAFDGTVLFVSHDRYFIRALADKIIKLDERGMTEFKGSYEEYLSAERKLTEAKKDVPTPENNAKNNDGFKGKQARAEEAKKRQRIREIEKEITELEAEQAALSTALADPAVTADFRLLKEKCDRLEEIKIRTDALYEEYENII